MLPVGFFEKIQLWQFYHFTKISFYANLTKYKIYSKTLYKIGYIFFQIYLSVHRFLPLTRGLFI